MYILAQIAPLIRVCLVTRGDTIERGTEFGDGSRVEFVLPGRISALPHTYIVERGGNL